jgi:mannosyl-3-phosphoglycerate phosphatase
VRADASALPLVVFSDVDGVPSLSEAPASATAAVLEPVVRAHVRIVLCSNKTRTELEVLQQDLRIDDPFICEGGGAIFITQRYFGFAIPESREIAGYDAIELGRSYREVIETLHHASEQLDVPILGFSDMTVDEVATQFRLPLLDARLAKLREYQEVFRFLNGDLLGQRRFIRALNTANLRCVRHGDHYYAGGPVDPSVGIGALCQLYRRSFGDMTTVGIVDRFADSEMIPLVDHRVVVGNASGPPLKLLDWATMVVKTVGALGALAPSLAAPSHRQ